jgi:hypothetical protein
VTVSFTRRTLLHIDYDCSDDNAAATATTNDDDDDDNRIPVVQTVA